MLLMPSKIYKTIIMAVIGTIMIGTSFSTSAQSNEKYAVISVNQTTGEILHERHADAIRYPASLTKVMTLYLLFEKIKKEDLSLETRIPVSANAAKQPPSKIGVKAGTTIKIDDAISALINKSANDVAVVVAEYIAGSEKNFAKIATRKARELGMTKTVFRNASGLPNRRQVTTARDMLVLAVAMFENYNEFYHRFSEKSFRWGKRRYDNTNKLLKSFEGADGIKTGYIRDSGFNLMASAKRNNERIIAIYLGGRNSKTRNINVAALLNAGFTQSNPEFETQHHSAQMSEGTDEASVLKPLVNGKPFDIPSIAQRVYINNLTPSSESTSPAATLAEVELANTTILGDTELGGMQ